MVKALFGNFPYADIVIPPASNAVYNKENHWQRNRILWEIKTFGRMGWQRARNYGKRNYSELAIQRYKRILGRSLHARELARQKNEAMIGCGILTRIFHELSTANAVEHESSGYRRKLISYILRICA